MSIKSGKFLFALTIAVYLSGCTVAGQVLNYDSSLIPYDTEIPNTSIAKSTTFLVGGDKTFSGKPSRLLGRIFRLNLDLEKIQIECAKKIIGEGVLFQSKKISEFEMKSSMTNFDYYLQNIGPFGQQVIVSFELNIVIKKNGRKIFQSSSIAKDYVLSGAELRSWRDIVFGPYMGKADKLAHSAFILTAIFVCDEYRVALETANELLQRNSK